MNNLTNLDISYEMSYNIDMNVNLKDTIESIEQDFSCVLSKLNGNKLEFICTDETCLLNSVIVDVLENKAVLILRA